jgi:2-methylcitrate dehydratase PrpD
LSADACDFQKRSAMTIARTLAAFVADYDPADLPAQTLDHAAMLIASTIASAAAGRDISSAVTIRELTQERGGRKDATIWFYGSQKLPAVHVARANALMSDAAASDDSDLRNITHAGTPLTASTLAMAEKTGASGGPDWGFHHTRLSQAWVSRLHHRHLQRRGGNGAVARSRCRKNDSRHRAVGDIDRRACRGRK